MDFNGSIHSLNFLFDSFRQETTPPWVRLFPVSDFPVVKLESAKSCLTIREAKNLSLTRQANENHDSILPNVMGKVSPKTEESKV